MKLHLLSAVLAATAVIALAAPAPAQAPVRANERYCLQSFDPAPAPLLCRFETLEQCMASKVGHGDSCWLNPILAFRERR